MSTVSKIRGKKATKIIDKIRNFRTVLAENKLSPEPIIYIISKEEAAELAEQVLETLTDVTSRLELAKGIGERVAWKMMDGSRIHEIKVAVDGR